GRERGHGDGGGGWRGDRPFGRFGAGRAALVEGHRAVFRSCRRRHPGTEGDRGRAAEADRAAGGVRDGGDGPVGRGRGAREGQAVRAGGGGGRGGRGGLGGGGEAVRRPRDRSRRRGREHEFGGAGGCHRHFQRDRGGDRAVARADRRFPARVDLHHAVLRGGDGGHSIGEVEGGGAAEADRSSRA